MASNECRPEDGPQMTRRTEDDLRRRRDLADAAAGISASEAAGPADAAHIERFRCVIYVCAVPDANLAELRKECTEYAEAFCWGITAVIEDDAGGLPPRARTGLARAVEHIRSGEAGAVVTARRSMISPVTQEYERFAHEVETAGGFLHVMDSTRGRTDVEHA
ncbi:hypothetical protein ACFVFQ_28510 [Streptomyces sp. NPDC057743]|uniref:hypothetical protein n=1 Tax=Streptomyces sp. NPDC057743 TaxID=3346236 RepID=UPI00368793DA